MLQEHTAVALLEQEHGSTEPPPAGQQAMTALREAVRARLQRRPYLILGGVCWLGLAVGTRRRSARRAGFPSPMISSPRRCVRIRHVGRPRTSSLPAWSR